MNVQHGSFKHKPWFIFLINVLGLLASAKKSDLLRFKIRHCEQINQILFDLEKKVIFYIVILVSVAVFVMLLVVTNFF